MSKILMLALAADAIKAGLYKTGPNQGKEYAIAVGRFAGPNGRIVSRIIPNVDVAKAFQGSQLNGSVVEATVEPYSFMNAKNEKVTTDKKWIVQFEGETLSSAIKAHGKKPALLAAPVSIQENASADVAAA